MVASARTLADISDERIVPVDYLAVLLVLFFFIVLDRLVYTLGLHLGKVCPPPCFVRMVLLPLLRMSFPCDLVPTTGIRE